MNTSLQIDTRTTVVSPWRTPPTAQSGQTLTAALPADTAVLSGASAATAAPAAGMSARRIALLGLGIVALGMGAAMIPGPSGSAMAAASVAQAVPARPAASPPVSFQAPATVASKAPVTMTQASDEMSLERADMNVVAPTRPFGNEAQGVRIETSTDQLTKTVDGRQVALSYVHSTLLGADGRALYTPDGSDWAPDAFNKDARQDWNVQSTLEPAGSAGRFVSVKLTEGGRTDGKFDGRETSYVTIDRASGDVVNLDEVIGKGNFDKIVGTVHNFLSASSEGQRYKQPKELLIDIIQSSFTLKQDGGHTVVGVAVPPAQQTDAGTVAHFEFRLPSIDLH